MAPPTLMTAEGLPRPGTFRSRPCVRGKSMHMDGEKLLVRGVTYGGFRPGADGAEFPCAGTGRRGLRGDGGGGRERGAHLRRAAAWLLDLADEHGLWVMVGLPWEQHVTFLDEPAPRRAIEERVREAVAPCRGSPRSPLLRVGNEIPAADRALARPRRIERSSRGLPRRKQEDPDGLVTYVNYPSHRVPRPPVLDFVSFNVFLESDERFESYLARLQNLAGDRPL